MAPYGTTIKLAGYKIGYSPSEKVGDWAGMDNETEQPNAVNHWAITSDGVG